MSAANTLVVRHRKDVVDLIGRRLVATVIDYALMFGFLMLGDYSLGNDLYQKTIAFWLGVVVLYIPLCEALVGFTIGKAIVGLRVRRIDGSKGGWKEALIRSGFRLIEVNPVLFGGIPSLVAVATTRDRQRVGDILAKTLVVRTDHLRAERQGEPGATDNPDDAQRLREDR